MDSVHDTYRYCRRCPCWLRSPPPLPLLLLSLPSHCIDAATDTGTHRAALAVPKRLASLRSHCVSRGRFGIASDALGLPSKQGSEAKPGQPFPRLHLHGGEGCRPAAHGHTALTTLRLQPVRILRVHKLRISEPKFQGIPYDLGIPPLNIYNYFD